MNIENPTNVKKPNNRNRNRNRTRKLQRVQRFNQSIVNKYRNKPAKGEPFVFNISPKVLNRMMNKEVF